MRIWNASHEFASTLHPSPILPGSFRGGWVFSGSSRLIWVPPLLQNDFCMPWCSYVIGPWGVNTLDLSTFVYGTEWERCTDIEEPVGDSALARGGQKS
ncbi:hypothetical protein R3P38DRAFT_3141153 [Favolaschia claudopus]|uniref:Uncharacterized protein n=1 Tax=Favolaschia claudopus TaxID=2862362 RepID=A0AAV9Z5B1_9AGAR